MPICKHCKVEVESNNKTCPLCHKPLEGIVINHEEKKQKIESKTKNLSKKSPLLLELFTFFAAASAIIVAAVDFAYGADLTWSRIPLISLFFSWLFIFLIYHFVKKPYLLVTFETCNVLVFLWFLDYFTKANSWFFGLALPIVLAIALIFLLIIFWIRFFKLSTLFSIAAATLATGFFQLLMEVILNRFIHNRYFVSWSLVAFACILPVSGLFIYLQIRLNKGSDLNKYFHI